MSVQIEIELSEETSQIIYENYEKVKNEFESFDEIYGTFKQIS